MKTLTTWAAVLTAAVYLSACAGARRKSLTPAQKAGAGTAAQAGAQEASLRARVYEEDSNLKIIHFDLDSTDFSEEALSILKANAEYLKSKGADAVLIEGYADDRGTIEYNLALGQRRAEAMKEYYHSLGIPVRRMSTISYGKLKPICSQDDEKCWGQNRRGETKRGTPVE